jgi:pimeloyl-ACP methyl ester carboxylesterase
MGHGPAVIFMHGGMGDCWSWGPQLDAFAQDYRAVAYSRRLHSPNRDPNAAVHPSLDQEAADLDSLLDALQTGPAHLVATSYGAMVALAFALRHPHRVRSMVLAEPPLHRWACATLRGTRLLRQFMGRCWTACALCVRRRARRKGIAAADRRHVGTTCLRRLTCCAARGRTSQRRRDEAAHREAEALPDLPRAAVATLTMPVFLVEGASTSELHRRAVDELDAVLPNRRRTVIERAGHASAAENPDAFNAAVLGFIRAVDTRAAGRM